MPTPQSTLTGDVKLVIWDLDDTFWTGTLAEGPVEWVAANIELVKQLTSRDIIRRLLKEMARPNSGQWTFGTISSCRASALR